LGLAYWKNNEKAAATENLESALRMEGNFPERQQATELLKEINGSRLP
jgi:hypothetical protein